MQRSWDTFSFRFFSFLIQKLTSTQSFFEHEIHTPGSILLTELGQNNLCRTTSKKLEDAPWTGYLHIEQGCAPPALCWNTWSECLKMACRQVLQNEALNLRIASPRAATSSCHRANLPKADASLCAPPLIVILIQHYLILSYYSAKRYIISLLPGASSGISPH